MFTDLVKKNRSYRRFDAAVPVKRETLESLVDLARHTASGGNLQPLKYKLVCDTEGCKAMLPALRWAGYLTHWEGPTASEAPTGYIMVMRDNEITTNFIIDHGIAAQTIMLGAVEKGFGGCIIGTLDRQILRTAFDIPARYEILLVLALGKPTEEVVIEEAEAGTIKYWRDDKDTHHVPKRPLSEVILD